MALQVGQNVGPYRVIEQLGAGGMATVYKAYHARLDRYVSLKVMHQSFLEDPTFRARFEREAQIVAKLSHPNIVPVYDFSDYETQPYLVLKYIDGMTLKAQMSQGALPMAEIVRLMTAVGDGLTYAHKQGVLHRDIKPSNVILDESGTPYLTDFGLARIAQAGESTMSADVMLGTPQYISPEQARGLKDLDARTDVYSFGVVLYEMVCGRVPFNSDTPYAIVHDHIYSPLPLPSQINPNISTAVENVLLKALAKEPADRFDSANQLMQAFRAALENTSAPVNSDNVITGRAPKVEARPAETEFAQIPKPEKPKVGFVPPMPPTPPVPPSGASFRDVAKEIRQGIQQGIEREFEKQIEHDLEHGDGKFARGAEKFARRMEERRERQERRGERWEQKGENWSMSGDPGGKNLRLFVDTEGLDDDDKRDLALDLATDETSIRKRVEKRIKDRRDLIGHIVSYTLVNIMLWFIFGRGAGDFPWPMFVTLGWGAGLSAHLVSTFFKSAGQLERRDRNVQQALEERYGGGAVSQEEYQEVRQQVYIQHKKVSGFFAHVAVYLCINAMLWSIFGLSSGDFPWPMFVTIGWGLGVLGNASSVFGKSGKRNENQEELVQREIERERQLRSNSIAEKRKHDNISGEDAPPVRLTQEGELTDSFVEEWDAQKKRKRN